MWVFAEWRLEWRIILSNVKLVVAGLAINREQSHCALNLRAGKLNRSIATKGNKTQKSKDRRTG